MSLYQAFLEALVRIEILRERFVQIGIDDTEKVELVWIVHYLFDEYSRSTDEIILLIDAHRSGGQQLFESTLYDIARSNDIDFKDLDASQRNHRLEVRASAQGYIWAWKHFCRRFRR